MKFDNNVSWNINWSYRKFEKERKRERTREKTKGEESLINSRFFSVDWEKKEEKLKKKF